MRFKTSRRVHVVLSALLAGLCSEASHAIEISTTWTGNGGNNLWSNALNWDCTCVPTNAGPVEFNVTILAGVSLVQHNAILGANTIKRLTLGNNSTLRVVTGSTLTVLQETDICGIIDAMDDFSAVGNPLIEGDGAVFSCDTGRAYVRSGACMIIDASAYSSIGLPFTTTLLLAEQAGSKLDLSSLIEPFDASFTVGGGAFVHTISATNSGTIDLSIVPAILGPGSDERLEFVVNSGGNVNLSSLQTISGSGSGRTRFFVNDAGSVQSLPSLETADRLTLHASAGGVINADGPQPLTYSSTGMQFAATLLSADGPGSAINLPAMSQPLDASFTVGGGAFVHTISATNSGTIDLSNVEIIREPGSDERLEIKANSDGFIDLSSLVLIEGLSGRTYFLMASGGTIETAGLQPPDGTLIDLENATPSMNGTTTMHVGGDLNAATDDVTMNLDHAETLLDVDGSILVRPPSTLIAGADEEAVLNVGGRLCFTHASENDFKVGSATVHLDGSGTEENPQILELGGLDFDLLCGSLVNDNFGYGRLIIGQEGQPTVVELRDDFDNGNSGGGNPEALYLFGPDGLDIRGGSTLVINELHVYLCDAQVRIHDLLRGVDEIAYGGGFIRMGNFPVAADVNDDRTVDTVDFLELLKGWGPCTSCGDCLADLDCDCNVGTTDFLLLLENWG